MGADQRETHYSDVQLQVCEMTIVQCYAPTNDAKEEKEQFYEQIQVAKDKIPKHNLCSIMGDFNAKVGSDNTTFERTMGRNRMGDRNENGQQLVKFCSEYGRLKRVQYVVIKTYTSIHGDPRTATPKVR